MAVARADDSAFERYDLRRVGNGLGIQPRWLSGELSRATSAALASDHRWISGGLDSVRCRVLPRSLSHLARKTQRTHPAKTLRYLRVSERNFGCV